MLEKICERCKWWNITTKLASINEDFLGICDCPKIHLCQGFSFNIKEDEALCSIEDGHWSVEFITGRRFGCTHFRIKNS